MESYLSSTVGQSHAASDGPPATSNVRNVCLAGLNVKISGLIPIIAEGNPRIARHHPWKDVMSGGISLNSNLVLGSKRRSLNLRAEVRAGEVNPFLGEGLASLAQSPFDTRPRLQRQLMLFDKFSHSHLTVALLVYHDDSAICGSDRKRESSICSRASDGHFRRKS